MVFYILPLDLTVPIMDFGCGHRNFKLKKETAAIIGVSRVAYLILGHLKMQTINLCTIKMVKSERLVALGSRTSILVALAAAACSLIIGVVYGAFSGLVGGRIDNLMMRVVDVLYSVPFIFVVIFLITVVNEYRTELEDLYGIDRELIFFVVIGAIYWLTMARVVRGQVLSLKNSEFIEAARVLGASTRRILFAHLVPNVLSIVIVYLTLTIPAVMLFEAFLSFLGLGIEPPKVSWGLLAVDGTTAINPLRIYWWLVVFPALAMGLTLLSLNVLGDGLRDALDPKLRGKD